MRLIYLMILTAVSITAVFVTQAIGAGTTEPPGPYPCQEAITVFQDVSRIGRKDGAAKNITQKHQEMARERWRFVDVEPYTENGDLEGFYVSYVRDSGCPPQGK